MRKAVTGLAGLMVIMPSVAAAEPIQLRVDVAPGAGDAIWKNGAVFEKRGECFRLKSAAPTTSWPPAPADIAGQGAATAPLFNPGFANPDGTYQPNSADDSFNTLFVPMTDDGTGKAMICRGTILADGRDVTSRGAGTVSARSYESIGSLGPMGVRITLARGALTPPAPTPIAGGIKIAPQPILQQGALDLRKLGWVDFEAMTVSPTKTANAQFLATGMQHVFRLEALNGTVWLLGKSDAPIGYAGCAAMKPVAQPWQTFGDGGSLGTHYCFRMGSGRLGEIKVVGFTTGPNETPNQQWPTKQSMMVDVIVWK